MKHTIPYVDFCLECESDGKVLSVIKTSITMDFDQQTHVYLQDLIADASISKAEEMLQQVETDGVSIDWELQVKNGKSIVWMVLSGFRVFNKLIIIGSTRKMHYDLALFDEMMQINNDQSNQIRELVKENIRLKEQLAKLHHPS
jgi:hypothetical protein